MGLGKFLRLFEQFFRIFKATEKGVCGALDHLPPDAQIACTQGRGKFLLDNRQRFLVPMEPKKSLTFEDCETPIPLALLRGKMLQTGVGVGEGTNQFSTINPEPAVFI